MSKAALVDRLVSQVRKEKRAPGADVAVIADWQKRTFGLPWGRTMSEYGHRTSGGNDYLSREKGLTEFHEASVKRLYGTPEISKLVNEDQS
ncbi:hypothetical protein ACFQVB_33650 [Paraburkholderia humisilvae]